MMIFTFIIDKKRHFFMCEIISLFTFPYKTLTSYNKTELSKLCSYHQIRPMDNTKKGMVQSLEFTEDKKRTKIIVLGKSLYINVSMMTTFSKTYEDIYRIVYQWNKSIIRYDKNTNTLEASGFCMNKYSLCSIKSWINIISYYETYHVYTHLLLLLDEHFLIKDIFTHMMNVTITQSDLLPIIYKIY